MASEKDEFDKTGNHRAGAAGRTASGETGTDRAASETSKKLDVSPAQVVGGALASVTAAGLGSTLGVAGTVLGAGLTSVVITVGGALYQRSLERTKERANLTAAKAALKRAKQPLNASGQKTGDTRRAEEPAKSTEDTGGAGERPADAANRPTRQIRPVSNSALPGMHWPGGEQVVDEPSETRRIPELSARIDQEGETRRLRTDGTGGARSEPDSAEWDSPADERTAKPSRRKTVMLAVSGALMFGLAMLGITGFEGVTGKPLSGGESGTSLGQVFRPGPPVQPEPELEPQPPPASSEPGPSGSSEPSQPPESTEPSTSVRPSAPGSAEPGSTAPEPTGPSDPAQPTESPARTETSGGQVPDSGEGRTSAPGTVAPESRAP